MKLLQQLTAVAVLFFAANGVAHANTKTVCGYSPEPGYVATDLVFDLACGQSISQNAVVEEEYDNLAVGVSIAVCYYPGAALPGGWTLTSSGSNAGKCGGIVLAGEINVGTIYHSTCVNESQSLCYPVQPVHGSISASPTSVRIPYGQSMGSTSVSYNITNGSGGGCVWIQNSGGSAVTLWSCGGASGTQNWPYVPANGSTTFFLSQSSSSPSPTLATTVVNGVLDPSPVISASPTSVTVPAGQSMGSTLISWNTTGSGYATSCIWIQNSGGGIQLWGCNGTSGSATWPYVPKGGSTTLWLAPGSSASTPHLATVVVSGH